MLRRACFSGIPQSPKHTKNDTNMSGQKQVNTIIQEGHFTAWQEERSWLCNWIASGILEICGG